MTARAWRGLCGQAAGSPRGSSVGNSVLRAVHCAPVDWPLIQTGAPANANQRMTMSTGNGLMQPLDAAARKAGVEYLLEHKDDIDPARGTTLRPGTRHCGEQ